MSPARWPPTRVEVALAAGVAVAGLAELLVPFSSRQGSGPQWSSSVAVCLVSLSLLWVRRVPLVPLVGFLVIEALGRLAGATYVLFYGQLVPFLIAVFFVARYQVGRLRWVGAGVAALVLLGIDLFIPELADPNEILFHWVVTALVFGAGYGLVRWERRAREATRRAVEAEVGATERAMAAVIDERTRIARELHDIVATASARWSSRPGPPSRPAPATRRSSRRPWPASARRAPMRWPRCAAWSACCGRNPRTARAPHSRGSRRSPPWSNSWTRVVSAPG